MLKHSSVSVSVGSLGPGMHKVCVSPLSISDGYGVDSKCYFTLPTVLLGLLLCPWTWGISSQSLQCHAAKAPELRTCRTLSLTQSVSSVAQSCPTLCDPMNHSTPGLPVHHQLLEFLKLMPIASVMPSSHLILRRPLLLLLSIPPSIRVFSNESPLRMRWPKYWSFSFSISPSNEKPGLISFRMDWLDLLAVQRTLKSLLQQHSSKASIF